MRGLSAILMGLGVALGAILSVAVLLHLHVTGLHSLFLVGLAKLVFVSALGLIATGGFVRRLAIRAEERELASQEGGHRLPRGGDGPPD